MVSDPPQNSNLNSNLTWLPWTEESRNSTTALEFVGQSSQRVGQFFFLYSPIKLVGRQVKSHNHIRTYRRPESKIEILSFFFFKFWIRNPVMLLSDNWNLIVISTQPASLYCIIVIYFERRYVYGLILEEEFFYLLPRGIVAAGGAGSWCPWMRLTSFACISWRNMPKEI